MANGLDALRAEFLDPDEPFRGVGVEQQLRLGDYWRWSGSCVMDNTARGVLAEFLVATALRQIVGTQPRVEWEPYDLEARIGGRNVTIEVKSSSKIQSWAQRAYSPLQFRIAPTLKWDSKTGQYSERPLRADIYVFCVFAATNVDAHTAALNVDHWRFRVIPGAKLPDQQTVTWNRLDMDGKFPECHYGHLASQVEAAANRLTL